MVAYTKLDDKKATALLKALRTMITKDFGKCKSESQLCCACQCWRALELLEELYDIT